MHARDIAFWLIFLATPLVVSLLARESRVSLRLATIPAILALAYAAFAYVGLPLLYYQLDPLRVTLGLTDPGLLFTMLAYASLAFVGMGLGFWLHWRLIGPVPQTLGSMTDLIGKATLVFCGLLFALGVAAYLHYLSRTPHLALLASLRRDYEAQVLLRSQMTNALYAGSFDWAQLFYKDITSFLCFFLFSLALTRRSLWVWLFWGAVLLFLAATSLLAAQKAPLIHLLAGLFFAFVLTRQGGRLTLRNLSVLAVVVAVGLVALACILATGSPDFLANLAALASRMLTGSLAPAYYYLKMFPAMHGYLHGASLSNLQGLLPFASFDLTRAVHDYMVPEYLARGIVGSAPTAFWGEAYANFGPAGPLLVAVPVGFCACLLQNAVCRLPASPVTVGLLTWLILHVLSLSITSFSNYLTDQHLVVVALAALCCLLPGPNGLARTLVKRLTAPAAVTGRHG